MSARRGALALAALAASLVAVPAARADELAIKIPNRSFSPGQVELVPGDRVTWSNGDFTTHEVRANDGSFDSGLLPRGSSFSRTFTQVGRTSFLCPLHPFMTGQVDVRALLLTGPGVVAAGQPAQLTGRAPAGAGAVTLERQVAGGWEEAGTASPASGVFSFSVQPSETTTYRARSAQGTSEPVNVLVAGAVRAEVRARRAGHVLVLRVTARPAIPGLHAHLQRYARWRFAWRWGRHLALRDGRGRFELRRGDGLVRVVLTRGAMGAPLAVSAPVRLRDGHRARDPLGRAVPGHHGPAPAEGSGGGPHEH
jgi:plastocyanin